MPTSWYENVIVYPYITHAVNPLSSPKIPGFALALALFPRAAFSGVEDQVFLLLPRFPGNVPG